MLGAIIGDVVGSYYEVLEVKEIKKGHRSYEERIKILDQNTPLFTNNSSVTDDSILTFAIYKAIKDNKPYEEMLKYYAKKEIDLGKDMYGRSRFGKGFVEWVNGNTQGTSYGNGASMRISPVGYLFDTLEEVKQETYKATIPSHNHEESILCAEAVSTSIFLLRNGISKEELKEYIEKNYFKLDYDLEDLRRNYKFSSKSINSVPQAIFVFLESNSFEETIRNAISIGGDTDTIACIAGSLAESYYGIPEELLEQVKPYLKDYMKELLDKEKVFQKR
ncbi:MAG: ADP-ribosylglycohydrolase family protein [Bacilli bacterium]|nr:ADP-ribosylglycohydrolase family protein [Bacilli bacterium]